MKGEILKNGGPSELIYASAMDAQHALDVDALLPEAQKQFPTFQTFGLHAFRITWSVREVSDAYAAPFVLQPTPP